MLPASQNTTPSDRAQQWCPSDKRVRCINCAYLHDLGENEHQCRNEDGPVAMWMFLADSEPKETWCEAFKPNDWMAKQGHLPVTRTQVETDLLAALINIIAAEHAFVGDTGIDWTDEITIAVRAAEAVIAKTEAV